MQNALVHTARRSSTPSEKHRYAMEVLAENRPHHAWSEDEMRCNPGRSYPKMDPRFQTDVSCTATAAYLAPADPVAARDELLPRTSSDRRCQSEHNQQFARSGHR